MSNNNDRNSKRIEATEDDDFGDFEGPEDEAPESVQAMGGPPNWVFPDLLRVQTTQSSHEEPESLSTNSSTAMGSHSRVNAITRLNETSIRGAIGRETGAIPKQRALDPPDVSLLTNTSQPKLPTTLDLCSSALRSNSYSRDSSSAPSVIPVSQSGTSPLNRQLNIMSPDLNSSHNGSVDPSQSRIVQLERDLKALQTQKAVLQQQLLQKDTQIRELHSQSRQSVPNLIPIQAQDSAIITLTETMDRFRTTIEASIKQLEERLVSLESRLTNSSADSTRSLSNNVEDVSQSPNRSLKSLIEQQKRVN
jgi:hypothetical protein